MAGTPFKMKSSPAKLFGWLTGRKKEIGAGGEKVVTRKGKVVKTKTAEGVKTKYKGESKPEIKSYEYSAKADKTKKGRIVHY